jgi:hypothetical protein
VVKAPTSWANCRDKAAPRAFNVSTRRRCRQTALAPAAERLDGVLASTSNRATRLGHLGVVKFHLSRRHGCDRASDGMSMSCQEMVKHTPFSEIRVRNHTGCLCIVYSATHTAAMPMPVPTHILVTPICLPVRLSSVSRVLTCLAPVTPRGCPKAIAPPFGLILA